MEDKTAGRGRRKPSSAPCCLMRNAREEKRRARRPLRFCPRGEADAARLHLVRIPHLARLLPAWERGLRRGGSMLRRSGPDAPFHCPRARFCAASSGGPAARFRGRRRTFRAPGAKKPPAFTGGSQVSIIRFGRSAQRALLSGPVRFFAAVDEGARKAQRGDGDQRQPQTEAAFIAGLRGRARAGAAR